MYLGLDLGTSGLKGVLIGDTQAVIGHATAALSVSRPQSGWSEQEPSQWLRAVEEVLDALAAKHDLSAVKGIGLSGQMHGATLLNAADEVLRPCILWNDTRSHAEAAIMDADPRFRHLTGNIVFPGFTAPKLAWIRKHEPQIFNRVAKVLLPKDYLRLWLTGEHVAEMSDAAGTGWLNTAKRDWSDELLRATGLDRTHMPRLIEGSEVSGTLRRELCARWGLSADTVVAGGGGDNAASAVGMGAVQDGQAFLSLGTSGVLFAANDSYSPDAASAVHTFCHALPGRWHQMGVILSAGDALNWFAKVSEAKAADLTSALGNVQAPGRAIFLPYLGGERTPHNDARVRGAFIGLEHAADRTAMTRAVLEGVAFAFADCRDALIATGTTLERATAVGGGSVSPHWLQIMANATGLALDVPVSGDFGGAFGAARLGMMAAECAGVEIATPPNIHHTVEPDPALASAFADAHARYRAASATIRSLSV